MADSTVLVFGSAVALSIAFSLTPGAVATEALRRGMEGGPRAVLLVRVGALAGNLVWAAVAVAGGGLLVQLPLVRLLFGIAGSLVLLRMAHASLAAFRRRHDSAVPAAHPARHDLAAGAALALSSPLHVVFWLGIAGAVSQAGLLVWIAGFATGYLLYSVALALLLLSMQRTLGRGLMHWAHLAYGSFAAYLAIRLLLSTAGA